MTYTLAAVSGKRRLREARGPGVPGPCNSTKSKRLLHKEKIQVQQPLYG